MKDLLTKDEQFWIELLKKFLINVSAAVSLIVNQIVQGFDLGIADNIIRFV